MGAAMGAALKIEVVCDGLGFTEGPIYFPDGRVVVTSISRGCVYEIDATGEVRRTVRTGGGPNGLARAGDRVFVAQNGGIFGAPDKTSPGVQFLAGDELTYLTRENCEAPNDLCFGPDGLLYVTDPVTDLALKQPVDGHVLACDPETGHTQIVVSKRQFPNGLAFDPSGRHMYLAQTFPRLIERFSWTAGRLESDGKFCELSSGRPDGLAVDTEGNLWICTPGTGGIEVYSPTATLIQRIEFGSGAMTTNCCFGGIERQDLFVTAAGRGQLLRLRTESKGLELYPSVDLPLSKVAS
jgi:gluconolactonase